MIGKLTGTLDRVAGTYLILDVNGVGYRVTCSARTLRQVGALGATVALLIETHVREDAINLFGFATPEEQDWFNLLTTVQGVGARVALSILGSLSPDQLVTIIASQDKTAMTQAEGVGPKLALRLVTELKDKVQTFASSITASSGGGATGGEVAGSLSADALSALTNLGYRRAEAFAAVTTLARKNPQAKLDELIRLSLAELSRGDRAG